MSSGLGGRAESEIIIGCIFPCVLAAVTWVGGVAGNIGARTKAKSELGFFLCSMAMVTPINRPPYRLGSKFATEKSLRVRSKLALFLLSMKQ